ncbi:ATP-binding cassette domain-containing protein, partial [Nocardioides sp.]|uniref:ATP-binding cassette domain-containing protein n=1 Tax=Nocardioides sp. TaxID=35761 RepID=UPI0025D0ECFC
MGQNGAGKSTLIKIIAGAVAPDAGQVLIAGHEASGGVTEHRAAGVAVIYQEPQLVSELSALENVFLGATPRNRMRGVGWSAMRREYDRMCADLEVQIDPHARAASLSPGDRQLIEIMRALRAASAVLILDEPTTALPERERERLYRVLDQIKGRGTAVVFISHDLDDVLRICETVTVLKDGQTVTTVPATSLDHDRLVAAMTGEALAESLRPAITRGEELLSVRDLAVPTGVKRVSITAHAGEVVG